uniref:Uncharacterized protein n=1 Tax=Anguilla anguilla TaxID=7936 RepID=A0A0E9R980_ANGAN
MFYVSFCIFG